MISAGLEGRLTYMTYPEPWRGPPKQPPEFLRPAPKPIPPRYNGAKIINDPPSAMYIPSNRYNGGVTTAPNGTRLASSQRSINKYPSPPSIPAPVNLTQQHKDEINDDLSYQYRLYSPHFQHFPFSTMYPQPPYAHMMRPSYPTTTPMPPLEAYSPTTPTSITSSTFLPPPPTTFSPPKPATIVREKRTPPAQPVAFKVPSGKEGSLKHRILTRPDDNVNKNVHQPLDLQKSEPRKRLNASMSPPSSPKRALNNNTVTGSFAKGSLIQLANGELRRIEDLRTEDFVTSAEKSPELRLAESTVFKIVENHTTGTATITLSYNKGRTQVEVESSIEHPYFVFGQGWASCNPDRTQQGYGLKVHRLQVGDILISLTPREQHAQHPRRGTTTATIMTTATTTAMTVRQVSVNSATAKTDQGTIYNQQQTHPINLHNSPPTLLPPPSVPTTATAASSSTSLSSSSSSLSPDSRKRRWSAPEQICDENEQTIRKHRPE